MIVVVFTQAMLDIMEKIRMKPLQLANRKRNKRFEF
jgi:hypothetical protein